MCQVTARRACTNGRTKYADFTIVPLSKIGKTSANSTSCSATNGLDDDRLTMNIIGPEHGIIYLLKDPRDPLLHIYLYESDNLDDVSVTYRRNSLLFKLSGLSCLKHFVLTNC